MIKILLVLFLGLGVQARAERMIREGTQSTGNSIFVSSLTANVTMGGSLVVNSSGSFVSSVTASAFFGDGSHLTGVSATSVPTQTILTSGTGATYTTPTNVREIRIRMVGGGGGAGGWNPCMGDAGTGGGGGTTSFNSVTALGGGGGYSNTTGSDSAPGGSGGSGGNFRMAGGPGLYYLYGATTGGNSVFGGAGAGKVISSGGTPNPGKPNSGSGGGTTGAGSGGAGEYVEYIISGALGGNTYTYTIAAGGGGGAGGSGGCDHAGGDGGTGVIIVDEYY